ncbi:hypothetical protein IAT40_001669 [Kwoniella sp. CBS 6097]
MGGLCVSSLLTDFEEARSSIFADSTNPALFCPAALTSYELIERRCDDVSGLRAALSGHGHSWTAIDKTGKV